MSRAAIGWIWVAGQAVLLGALILLPGRTDWPTPGPVDAVASVLFFGGLGVVGLAALGLGTSLTPTPVPTEHGALTTSGFYRHVRHPIYSGVLAVVAGMALRSGSWIQLGVAALTFVFFDRKARWEERRLAEHYDSYPTYAAATPRFVPQPWRTSARR